MTDAQATPNPIEGDIAQTVFITPIGPNTYSYFDIDLVQVNGVSVPFTVTSNVQFQITIPAGPFEVFQLIAFGNRQPPAPPTQPYLVATATFTRITPPPPPSTNATADPDDIYTDGGQFVTVCASETPLLPYSSITLVSITSQGQGFNTTSFGVSGNCFTVTIPTGVNFIAGPGLISGFNGSNQLVARAEITWIIPCLAPQTKILMADGTQKAICEIKRGDEVRGDVTDANVVYKVSRVNVLQYAPDAICDVVVIEPGALGENTPSDTLRLTGYHPIIYKGARREARCFRNIDGATLHKDVVLASVIEPEAKGDLFMYDLQFDFDAQYVAENTLVQSRSPWYEGTPLPRDLYFDASLYRDERTTSTLNHPLPFYNNVL